MRLAAQVEPARTEETSADKESAAQEGSDTATASIRNKRFERILSRLLASSKKAAAADGSDNATDGAEGAAADADETSSGKGSKPSVLFPFGATSNLPGRADDELLGMILTIRNKVNGKYVKRPDPSLKTWSWTVEYAIEQIEPGRAETIYEQLKKRRKDRLGPQGHDALPALLYA